MFRHRVRCIVAHIDDGDAFRLARSNINHIGTGRGNSDETQSLRALQRFTSYLHFIGNDDVRVTNA